MFKSLSADENFRERWVREATHPDATPLPGVGVRSKSGRALQWPPANRAERYIELSHAGNPEVRRNSYNRFSFAGSSAPKSWIGDRSRTTAVVAAARKIGDHVSQEGKRVKRV